MVRPATADDAREIARVHIASWRSTYEEMVPRDFLDSLSEAGYTERWTRIVDAGSTRVYVAEHDGELVGFASGGRERAGESGYRGELYAIYVLDSFQHLSLIHI